MIRVRRLGTIPYEQTFSAMQEFTRIRTEESEDELWVLQHPSVFTQGLAGKSHHILSQNHIPIIQTDRGGQVTYHGPGQLVIYPLLNLKRHNLNIKTLVCLIESSIIAVLKMLDINAYQRDEAPGVYVNNEKIASLGLRIKRGFSYHGLALNIDMDLSPFKQINPCGLVNQSMTQTSKFNLTPFLEIENLLIKELLKRLNQPLEYIDEVLQIQKTEHLGI